MHTRNCDMLLLIAIEIKSLEKDVESMMFELAEIIANEDKADDPSLQDCHKANPFVEKTESEMVREMDAMLEKLCYTCFKQHSHINFHLQSTSLD